MIFNGSNGAAPVSGIKPQAVNHIAFRSNTNGMVASPSSKLLAPPHRRFATRVQVWANGGYLDRVHGERADYLVHTGAAEITEEDRYAKHIWRIHLLAIAATVARRSGPARPAHPRHFATAAPVYLEVLGYTSEKRLATYAFHRITRHDAGRVEAERDNLRRKM